MMKFNTDPGFVGIETLKQIHSSQISEFEIWASKNDWERFHQAHFDWWVFPIDHGSSHGLKYTVYEGEVAELKSDPVFTGKYIKGAQLVSAS